MESWFKDIERATSRAEIVANARDYCALLHPRDLAPLPAECREIRIEDAIDIAHLRERLSTVSCLVPRERVPARFEILE